MPPLLVGRVSRCCVRETSLSRSLSSPGGYLCHRYFADSARGQTQDTAKHIWHRWHRSYSGSILTERLIMEDASCMASRNDSAVLDRLTGYRSPRLMIMADGSCIARHVSG
jgi:hypothetical protein